MVTGKGEQLTYRHKKKEKGVSKTKSVNQSQRQDYNIHKA